MHPQFLFNRLNTLVSEIEYDPKNAALFARRLSDVYRYVLQAQSKILVSVADEISFAESYIFLHRVRLGECITLENNIPESLYDKMIPPLTLQLLVENVIKHNTISPSKKMLIKLDADENYLAITNNISPKSGVKGTKTGLENLSQRCKLIADKNIIINNNEDCFIVKVPLCYE